LHPFFRQNLPEGFLLSIIREDFGPVLDGTDLSLLAVVGGMGIGRVTVTPEGAQPGAELDPLEIEDLVAADNTAENFAQLVRKYARAAISGAVPKFLAPEIGTDGPEPLGKSTLRTSRHIIKGSDSNTPYLGFNEYYAMQVLERLNVVSVAKTRMSDDGRVLIVDRFDVDANGMPTHGVEDACSLLGLPPHEKYATTMERVLEATRVYLPAEQAYAQQVQLGWHVLANYVVRNADCHSKNIALYYTQRSDVVYTPVYDIVTTQAYPRYATNPPGLSVEGRKVWTPGKSLETFFKSRLGIPPRDYAAMVEQLCDSAVAVGREMIEVSKNETRWREITAQMLHAWNDGMASLRSVRSERRFKGLTADIEAAGLPEPQRPPRQETIGRSPLLARVRRS
jgi:serine/threonine-protein kinase HipA